LWLLPNTKADSLILSMWRRLASKVLSGEGV
jgi:hypothetical protein